MDTSQTLPPESRHLVQQVQCNCDISDANHAGNYTLCIYLLKMREYYRWINALDFADKLDSERMSEWLREKEETWDQVAEQPFQPITLAARQFDIFDNQGINSQIKLSGHSDGLFYHAGIGQKAAQHFFLGERVEQYSDGDTDINITGKEYARDLTAPPAMSTQNEIIVRQESLKRLCWERYQEWHWNQYENPMGKALSYYPFDDSIPQALQMMVETEQNTLVQHELGEIKVTQRFGVRWSPMMLGLLGTKAELMARAVRDHLADCLTTLPALIEQRNPASLHFYFANLTYMRKEIFPSAMKAYQHWADSDEISELEDLLPRSTSHWENIITSILEISDNNTQNPATEIVQLIEHSAL